MKLNPAFFAFLAFALVTGCGSRSAIAATSDVDAQGNCAPGVLKDMLPVLGDLDDLQKLVQDKSADNDAKVKALLSTQQACTSFFASHQASTSCKVGDDTLKLSDISSACDAVNTILAKAKDANTEAPYATPAPDADGLIIYPALVDSETLGRIRVQVTNADSLKRLIDDKTLFILDGKVDTMDNLKASLTDESVLCYARPVQAGISSQLANGQVYTVQAQQQSKADNGLLNLTLLMDNGAIGFGCVKVTGESFTWQEIRNTTQGLFQITRE